MATLRDRFLVDEKGRKTAVVLPIRRYRKLIEDLHDLAIVAERKTEEPLRSIEMERRLKRDGLL